jgi:hypothetical protein
MPDVGALLPLNARFVSGGQCGKGACRAGRSASLVRSTLRFDFPVLLGLAAPSQNSLRSLRSLRSNNCDESVDDSRCARGPQALRCSAHQKARCGLPDTRLCGCARCVCIEHHHSCCAAGGARWGRFVWRRGAQAFSRRAQRASWTDSSRLFERSERSSRSEFRDATEGRAPQRSRREATTATA